MLTKSEFFEDYILRDFKETIGRTITETDFVIHAGQTGDFFPHHMDSEWCKTQPFGQRIAHGTLTFSVAIVMKATQINPEAFSKGYDRLRFIKPVYIADTIRVKVTISNKVDSKKPNLGQITEHIEVLNQRDEIVLVCDHSWQKEKKLRNRLALIK
jgi:acyl dehydratase